MPVPLTSRVLHSNLPCIQVRVLNRHGASKTGLFQVLVSPRGSPSSIVTGDIIQQIRGKELFIPLGYAFFDPGLRAARLWFQAFLGKRI